MDVCILQGKSITPEMPGACNRCGLYLNTCSPIIENGFLVGAECDYDYCCKFCSNGTLILKSAVHPF